MCAGRDLGERDSHQMQQWAASERSVSKVLLSVNRNNRKNVGRQTGCPVRVLRGSPSRANWALGTEGLAGVRTNVSHQARHLASPAWHGWTLCLSEVPVSGIELHQELWSSRG
jgi:hypothetical protein